MLTPESVDKAAAKRAAGESGGKGKVVELRGAGEKKTYASGTDGVSPGAPTDAEVKADLRQARAELSKFKRFLGTTAYLQTGPRAKVLRDGTAVAPDDAPEPVKRVIQAANAIAKFPYKWGGGHGAWRDNGYDCSGLGFLRARRSGPAEGADDVGRLRELRREGARRVDHDLRQQRPHLHDRRRPAVRHQRPGRAGTRWQENARGANGFAVRHVPGL